MDNKVVQVERAGAPSPVLFLCEHASNRFPNRFGTLGLTPDVMDSHVAWDPHALTITENLAARFDAPLVAGGVSRLLYDCNRAPEAPDAVPARSEVFDIPGNAGLSEAARNRRVEEIYDPFCDAVDMTIAACQPQAIVTIHTFTPVYFGKPRDVEIGILHDTDARLADAMLSRGVGSYVTRRNDPYGPQDGVTHSLKLHAQTRGLLNVMIEVRNDLTPDQNAMDRVCDALAQCLSQSLSEVGVTMKEGA
ncbi:N-formylglutamate amidohydrolase [Shimia biformata]|uniref:N-formylglutamate amidohydrolase n=1 Tax=Shimia biformata TaxID=1294299 RepID=UPI001EF2D60C|nr:N-formylglutamate amidohydrolase [Shimia biformata]